MRKVPKILGPVSLRRDYPFHFLTVGVDILHINWLLCVDYRDLDEITDVTMESKVKVKHVT